MEEVVHQLKDISSKLAVRTGGTHEARLSSALGVRILGIHPLCALIMVM